MPVVSAAGSYALDARLIASLPPGLAMARAAFGVAQEVLALLRGGGQVAGSHVLLLVGGGDNGGDALYAGAYLRGRGVGVTGVVLAPSCHQSAAAALVKAGGQLLQPSAQELPTARLLDRTALCVDGIIGIGGHGGLRPTAARWVGAIQAAGIPILAIDLPSGVDVDTGAVSTPENTWPGHVTATTTVTIGTYKPVHLLRPELCGVSTLVEIGHPAITPATTGLVGWVPTGAYDWPLPGRVDNKYTQGVTGVYAGSAQYPGAGVLATGAAIAATAGMVCQLQDTTVPAQLAVPEAVTTSPAYPRVQAWVIGPGAGVTTTTADVLEGALRTRQPVVIDADALTVMSQDPGRFLPLCAPDRVLLTPHDGEYARLANSPVGSDRIAAAQQLAQRYRSTALLKGATTIITDGHPTRTYLVDTGSSCAATPGSGDVLAGILGALWAAHPSSAPGLLAAQCVQVHAQAARLAATTRYGLAPTRAQQIIEHLGPAIAGLRAGVF